jgi:hypothetical protein
VAFLPARADVLLHSAFEDGGAAPWRAVGNGSVAVTRYAGNASLRLGSGAAAQARVSTRGFSGVSVTLSFAGWALGHGGRCSADVSIDAGRHWIEVHSLSAGADDGVTLRRGGAMLPDLANRDEVWLRLRTLARGDEAACWADEVEVTGVPLGGASATGGTPAPPALSVAALRAGTARGPWSMQEFRYPPQAQAPRHPIRGRLSLGPIRLGQVHVLTDRFGLAAAENNSTATLPAVTLDLVGDGTTLLPAQRGLILGSHPGWDWVFEPGRAWSDPDQPSITRAVLPFSLEERNANCLHNGLMTFAVDEAGTVSDTAFQISSETCAYFQFDQWGLLQASFEAAPTPPVPDIVAAYRREIAARLPVRPISQLATDYRGVDPTHFGSATEVAPSTMTTYGVVIDGIHYVGDCPTRTGGYPDCDELALPSYSLAKSLVAGLALMRLERLYPGTAAFEVRELVPECDSRAWKGVTLRHLLDMSSGHYLSATNQADEDGADLLPFFDAEDHPTRLSFACNHYPRREGPGQRWVYHTSDTYLLGTALARAYRRHAGSGADFYRDLLVRDLFAPLELNIALAQTRRTRDPEQQPFTGYGLTLHRDDVARLARYLLAAADTTDGGGRL